MLAQIKRVFSTAELRQKIFTTFLLLAACRMGSFIPVPGINADAALSLYNYASRGAQNLFQMIDLFSGGAFAQMTVGALGIMPHISASIILQLAIAIFPSLQREMKENSESARRKVGRWTRMITLLIAWVQAGFFARYAMQINNQSPGIIAPQILSPTIMGVSWLYYFTFILSMTAGTMLIMWIGEQISEKGIGNGISLIIGIGIVSSVPRTFGQIVQQLNLDSQQPGALSFWKISMLIFLFVAILTATILVIQGQRKVPLQYARRSVGRQQTLGGASYLPLKVNYAGVMPVIFASSLLMFPATIGQFLGSGNRLGEWTSALTPGSFVYGFIYVLLILFFSYFWTATQFHPDQIASDMKKNGAFIPGIRQGKATQDFLESSMHRITLIGAASLAALAIFPQTISALLGVDFSITNLFGGTSLLILVGVVLDTVKQVESHLMMKRYEGYMRAPRMKMR